MQLGQVLAKIERSGLDPQRPLWVAGPGGLYEVIDVREYGGAFILEIQKMEDADASTATGKPRRAARHPRTG